MTVGLLLNFKDFSLMNNLKAYWYKLKENLVYRWIMLYKHHIQFRRHSDTDKNKMLIGLSLNFKEFSLDGKFHIGMINKYLHYKPERFACKQKVTDWDEKKHRKVIEGLHSSDTFFFISFDENLFMTTHVQAVKKPYQHFHIAQPRDVFNPPNEEIENIIARKGFSCAYLYDHKYEKQQSEIFENHYSVNRIPLSLSKGLPYTRDEFGKKVFDTSGNPGRSEMISSTELLACWKMWFGREFYHLVPKERLLSFKGAFIIKELANDIVFVQLFENVEDSATKKAQQIQWAWRKWLNFHDLIMKHP